MAEILYCTSSRLALDPEVLAKINRKYVTFERSCIGGLCNDCRASYCVKYDDGQNPTSFNTRDSKKLLTRLQIDE